MKFIIQMWVKTIRMWIGIWPEIVRWVVKIDKMLNELCVEVEIFCLWQTVLVCVWVLLLAALHSPTMTENSSYLDFNYSHFKAILCNLDHDSCLWKAKLNDAHYGNFSETGSYFKEKMSSGFPLMSYNCSVCLQPFILAELLPPTVHVSCCSCSFCLQAAYMLLSGTSVNHRVEAEQS